MPLNDNQRRFIALYRSTNPRNATWAYEQSYRARGDVARQAASRLLSTNVNVQQAIAEADAQDLRDLGITAAGVLRELSLIGFADMARYATWGPDGVHLAPSTQLLTDHTCVVSELGQTRTKEGGSIRFKLHDKIAALEKLGRYLKLFTEEVEFGPATRKVLEHRYGTAARNGDHAAV